MLSIKVTGIDGAISRLQRAQQSLRGGRLMRMVGQTVQGQVRRRITSEKTAPSGAAWAPLKPATIAKKGHSNILIDKRRLVGSVNFRAGGLSTTVGTTPFYGVFLQSGTRKMVARPFMGLSAANEREVESVVANFVARQLM